MNISDSFPFGTGSNVDATLLMLTPILPVPKHGPALPPLTGTQHRYLVAADGLWLEVSRPWMHVVTRISELSYPVKMPVGRLDESLTLTRVLPVQLIRQFAQLARAKHDQEQAALIIYNATQEEYFLRNVDIIHNSGEHIRYRYPRLDRDEDVVLDMHTHAQADAFFSEKDDKDDERSVKFSMVLGHCHLPEFSAVMRLSVLGKTIMQDIPAGVLP